MALTRPNLKIAVTQNEACTTMTLADTTGEFPTATSGYGAPNTIVENDVTSLVIVVRNKSTGTYFTYTFSILLKVVQSPVYLSIDGGTATNIYSSVGAIAFPFISGVNEFNLWGSYGVTLPEFADGVYQIEYTISGQSTRTGALTSFSYTDSVAELVTCDICCCISKMWADLDPDCGCSDSAMSKASQADTWLQVALASADMGDVTKATAALTKAQALCDCSGCSGCN